MKILVSNDDGIDSAGILALVKSLREIADVTVVAPHQEQSAIGHAITMQTPLRVFEYHKDGKFFGYAIDGTPADCVKIGIRNIMSEPPDLMVSGINHGSNTAINIIYSGTVSAAREAAIMDVPSIAISVTSHSVMDFSFAAKVAKLLALEVNKRGLPKGTMINVNVPNLPEEQIAGILVTNQGKSKWDDVYEKRVDPYGRNYYWLTGNLVEVDHSLEFDQAAIRNNYVSVTPIHFDLTDYKTFEEMKKWKIENLFNAKANRDISY
ncbi:5'/3'-nucleotidase SurE [Ignavibacterium sp.]|uniref:5'/3'-nucleotidase SurE n=1 Tax=Ignavibacterium sp. TaxID=2651167 RepID=UPI00307D252E